MKLHLYQNSCFKGYWYWTSHRETEPTEYSNVGNSNTQNLYEHMGPSPMLFDDIEPVVDCLGTLVNDVIVTNEVNVSEQPNAEA